MNSKPWMIVRTKELQQAQTIWLNRYAGELWVKYDKIFPGLKKFDCPKIILNNRFTNTAGCNNQTGNTIQLASKFLYKFQAEMLTVILPHEMAHQIDFNLYGVSEKKCGHGENWRNIMVKLGLPPNKYHSLEL